MNRSAQAGEVNRSEEEIARHFVSRCCVGKQTTRSITRRAMLRSRSIVKITENVRKYAAEQAISEEDALKKRMEATGATITSRASPSCWPAAVSKAA